MIRWDGKRWYAGGLSLGGHEVSFLFAVMGRPVVSAREMLEIFWPDPDDEPDRSELVVRVVATTLRRKLSPLGWTICNRRGLRQDDPRAGYRLVKLSEDRMAA